jgi:hypothetical protein
VVSYFVKFVIRQINYICERTKIAVEKLKILWKNNWLNRIFIWFFNGEVWEEGGQMLVLVRRDISKFFGFIVSGFLLFLLE